MGLTYDQLFPGRFIKAGEMRGQPVTMVIGLPAQLAAGTYGTL